MPKYDDLPREAQRIIDPLAEGMARKLRIPIEEAREVIAARVVKTTHHPTHGTSH